MHDDENLFRDLLKAGARGYVLKSDAGRAFDFSRPGAGGSQALLHRQCFAALLETFLTKAGQPLSSRERNVVQLVAEGHSNKQIAAVLSISINTVEAYRASAMRKLGVTSMADLVRYAVRNNIVQAVVPARRRADPRRRIRSSIRTRIVFHCALRRRT